MQRVVFAVLVPGVGWFVRVIKTNSSTYRPNIGTCPFCRFLLYYYTVFRLDTSSYWLDSIDRTRHRQYRDSTEELQESSANENEPHLLLTLSAEMSVSGKLYEVSIVIV